MKPKVTCITINTDASFYHEFGVGGYAFHIVCDEFKIQKGGLFKINPKTPEEAEIMCIGNAIATLLAQKNLPKCDWLIINSDCKWGYEKIENNHKGLPSKVHHLWKKLILALDSKNNSFRHVKSHTGSQNRRSLANEWCDKEAKKWAKIAIKKIKR